jgi:hypothetical protein
MATSFQLTFDTADPNRQARFWAEALGYRIPEPPAGFDSWNAWGESQGIPEEERNNWSAIEDPAGVGPRIFFQRVPEGKTAKNRMHLDLNVGGARGTPLEERKVRVAAEVKRLKALGADDGRGAMERFGEYWVRMNDPEGNEFCLQ